MTFENRVKFEPRRLFELLALMTIGASFWFVATSLGLFDAVDRFVLAHGLMNMMLLSACVSAGGVFAVARSTLQLRRAVAARLAAEAVAERLARQDPLTGLGNRRHFGERAAALLGALKSDERLAALLIDLDRFKPVNDVHGHAAGNAVLCAVAERLLALAPEDSFVARLGGDEFVVLALGFESEAATGALAQLLIEAIRQPIGWGRGFVEVDATIGVAVASAGARNAEELLHAADMAMYEGKRRGRGVFRFFRKEMDEALRARAGLESELRGAIARDEILPFYQPVVALPGRELAGFEVLARWTHPTLGELSPQTFIPIAEECGLIGELFARVLRTACSEARNWPGHLHLSVNLSAQQLQDPRMPERILAVLTQTGFPARRLEVELTEKALMRDGEAACVALASLHNLGVGLTLDNFGASYSILSHLCELRFSKLKIDRSYARALSEGEPRAALMEAILQLGAQLRVLTTAEGVEAADNLEWLSNQGCSFGQGYLFGRAMPAEAASAYIGRDARRIEVKQSVGF